MQRYTKLITSILANLIVNIRADSKKGNGEIIFLNAVSIRFIALKDIEKPTAEPTEWGYNDKVWYSKG